MRIVFKHVLLACLIVAFPVAVQAAGADKIGVVSIDEAIGNSEAGKRAMAEFTSKVDAKQKEFARQGEELKRQDDEFRKKAVTLSNEAKAREQAAMEAKVKKYMDDQNNINQQLGQEQNRIMEPLFKSFQQVVADYAKKNGYSLILEKKAVHYSGAADLTADITREFDASVRRGK